MFIINGKFHIFWKDLFSVRSIKASNDVNERFCLEVLGYHGPQ